MSVDCVSEISAVSVPALTISYLFSSQTDRFARADTTSRRISTSSDASRCDSGARAPSCAIFILLSKVTDKPRSAAAACWCTSGSGLVASEMSAWTPPASMMIAWFDMEHDRFASAQPT